MKPFFPSFLLLVLSSAFILSCSSKKGEAKLEQITVIEEDSVAVNDSSRNVIQANASLQQIGATPHSIVLTGLLQHRLVTVYKSRPDGKPAGGSYSYSGSYDREYDGGSDRYEHFMPGIDILFGYNLLNVAHYDLTSEKLNFLFQKPVLVKSLYYPSVEQDSIDKKPVTRDYYLISVYDEDTNKDTILNKKDLRRFYHYNAGAEVRTQLIPADYSAVRSQYDSKNDVMYIFASHDENKNGTIDKKEPLHIFWFSLKTPGVAKRLY